MSPVIPFRDPNQPLEARIADLLSRLTPEEKVQMLHQNQPAIERLGIGAYKHGTEAAHGVAWLGPATMFPQPIGLAATWDRQLLKEVGSAIADEARAFYRRDPARNGLTLWAPTVDLERDPRWGRTEEAYGEDPYLVGELAGSLVRGIQGDHPVYWKAAATLKHFLGNNHETDRGSCSVTLDPRNLHEYYYQPFERLFRRAGAVSMMTAYNAVNGVPCNLNPEVAALVKDQWGCSFVVSDAGDVTGTNRDHHWFETLPEAVSATLKAGVDSITDDPEACLLAVTRALELGLLEEATVDQAVGRSLRVRMKLGEFDPPGRNPYEELGQEQIGSVAHEALAGKAAARSMVLLKNEANALPLPSNLRVAVLGPLADQQLRDWYSGDPTHTKTPAQAFRDRLGADRVEVESGSDHVRFSSEGKPLGLGADGTLTVGTGPARTFEVTDWGQTSHTFQDLDSGLFLTTDDRTLQVTAPTVSGWFTKEVILAEVGRKTVFASWNGSPITVGSQGSMVVGQGDHQGLGRVGIDAGMGRGLDQVRHLCTPLDAEIVKSGTSEAVRLARTCDVSVVVVGNHPLINAKETLDRPDLALSPAQVALIRAVSAASPRTILVVVSGYPFAIDEVIPLVDAVIHTSHSGPHLGPALVDLVFGDVEPTGRLPMTWYKAETKLPPLDDYDVMRGGRTYRWFQGRALFPFGHGLGYSQFQYLGLDPVEGSSLSFMVRVQNLGHQPGEDVVQVYLSLEGSPVPRPTKQLVWFDRVCLNPGEWANLRFDLDPRDLERWDVVSQGWVTDQGRGVLAAGPSSGDMRVSTAFEVPGSPVALREPGDRTWAADFDDHEGARLEFCPEGRSALTARWALFRVMKPALTRPRSVEVRLRTLTSVTLEFRWGRFDGPLAARLGVPGRTGWATESVAVEKWMEGMELVLVCDWNAGREEGVAWFRFLD